MARKRSRTKRILYIRWLIYILILMIVVLSGAVVYLTRQLNDAEKRYEKLQETRLVEKDTSIEVLTAKDTTEMSSTEEPSQTVSSPHVTAVGKPQKWSRTEALEQLEMLGQSYPIIASICENSERYPDKLLEALVNNPEMADFVVGWTDTHKDEGKGLTKEELAEEFPLFLQWDSRWGYRSYGDDSVIGLSGCGPTCVSMMLYYLTGDTELTPDIIADYSMRQGYYVTGTGTAWALMTEIGEEYDVNTKELSLSEDAMKTLLDEGGVIICAMRAGDFTAMGHFIVIYGYDEDGFYVNDPNCMVRSKKKWSYDRLSGQIKNLWGYMR